MQSNPDLFYYGVSRMGRRIRVLELLVTMAAGGGPKQVYELVRHLPGDEFEIVVAGPRNGPFFERFVDLGVRTVDVPAHRLGIGPLLRTARLVRRQRIDVVHTHGKGAGLYGRLAARWAGVPAVHTFHGIHYAGYPRLGQRLYLGLERLLGSMTHTVINVSPSQEAEGLRLGLFPPARSATVLNGIDVDALDLAARRAPIPRARLGLTDQDLVLGCVTRFDPVKRAERLLDAAQALAPRFPRLALLLIGGGGDQPRLRRAARDARLGERVVFTGWLPEPAAAYRALDLYVSASLKEGLPLSLLEAMGSGLAVVATDVDGHRDVVIHGETGLLVPAGDQDALVGAIASLLDDPERRRRMGEAGRRRVRMEFTLEAMVRKTAEIYRGASA